MSIREEYITMEYKHIAGINHYGPFYRPHDGDIVHVHPDFVQKYRDRGWHIVKNAKNKRLLEGRKE